MNIKYIGILKALVQYYTEGIPKVEKFGEDEEICFMAMDLLGPNLETLFSHFHRKLHIKCALQIIDQMV